MLNLRCTRSIPLKFLNRRIGRVGEEEKQPTHQQTNGWGMSLNAVL